MATLTELTEQLQRLGTEEANAIRSAANSAQLEEVRRAVFGKKGRLTGILRGMGDLSAEERPLAGKVANDAKESLLAVIEERAVAIRNAELETVIAAETFDVTLPGIRPRAGSLHPLTQTLREIEAIFTAMGFSIELGPDIEDDFHNFGALNFPDDHPARDAQDTLYLAENMLLRTHTSPVQIRTMQARKPPLAVIAPGKVYRCDTPDATHSPTFHQVEGFMVDTNIRFSDLRGVLETFIHRIFGENVTYRMRPSFFPFTEPSAEVDVLFERRDAAGRMIREPVEILGSGMIHPKVLENCGIDPERYTGFAFGMGVERVTMIRNGINNLGLFYDNDVRFLRQFE
jgi:phenylalanyl-tRNA synthetase alpha chain